MKATGRDRRRLAAAAALALLPAAARAVPAPTGELRPRLPAPAITLTGADGRPYPLATRLRGHATAVQLMFTGCSTTCPPQAALFGALASALPPQAQLLSISIDTLGDDAPALARWLQRLGATPAWQAAVPAARDLGTLVAWLRGDGARDDTHTAQVFLVDAEGRLCYRSGDMPPARSTVAMLGALARGA